MTSSLHHISAISLFVEDLRAAKAFYMDVFGVSVLFEDEASVAFKFDNLIVNLLRVEDAQEIVAPGAVAARDVGARFQLSVWVADVDAVCAQLRERGVVLNGPVDRPWGMRTANFVDPAGHGWEVGQRGVVPK
jgi:catechol 2,3-dioxygenase-like lactoylglutathione lyase family enzyme